MFLVLDYRETETIQNLLLYYIETRMSSRGQFDKYLRSTNEHNNAFTAELRDCRIRK